MPQTASLAWIDRTVMMIYFIFVLAVGFMLKSFMKASAVRCDGGEIAYRIKARNLGSTADVRNQQRWYAKDAWVSTSVARLNAVSLNASSATAAAAPSLASLRAVA
ncbi:MAG: hypothetical protein M3120_03630, partial [Pseudomonadota bacterium]|nr:hypothetical protein [Pseudomonadota bacterium]